MMTFKELQKPLKQKTDIGLEHGISAVPSMQSDFVKKSVPKPKRNCSSPSLTPTTSYTMDLQKPSFKKS